MSTREKQLAGDVLDVLDRFRGRQSSGRTASPHAQHRVRRSIPKALHTLALLSLARRIGLRRSRRLVSLAAMEYLRQQGRRAHTPRRR
jgi:hypothetical protein